MNQVYTQSTGWKPSKCRASVQAQELGPTAIVSSVPLSRQGRHLIETRLRYVTSLETHVTSMCAKIGDGTCC